MLMNIGACLIHKLLRPREQRLLCSDLIGKGTVPRDQAVNQFLHVGICNGPAF